MPLNNCFFAYIKFQLQDKEYCIAAFSLQSVCETYVLLHLLQFILDRFWKPFQLS